MRAVRYTLCSYLSNQAGGREPFCPFFTCEIHRDPYTTLRTAYPPAAEGFLEIDAESTLVVFSLASYATNMRSNACQIRKSTIKVQVVLPSGRAPTVRVVYRATCELLCRTLCSTAFFYGSRYPISVSCRLVPFIPGASPYQQRYIVPSVLLRFVSVFYCFLGILIRRALELRLSIFRSNIVWKAPCNSLALWYNAAEKRVTDGLCIAMPGCLLFGTFT